ncbi:MAG: hypothetical protein IPJ40_09920 [Saprospirales bacterium]|nr:hypothetical protein [Saprospirales bacterium]
MTTESLNIQEKEAIQKYFGKKLEELTKEEFQYAKKELRTKYHPDNFEKFEDETVREMATERFQQIEELSAKMESYFKGELPVAPKGNDPARNAFYAFDGLKIEVITADKDLKYNLFGTFYRWLTLGEQFKIPDTANAYIIMDESHQGTRIGYSETIRMYLTFGKEDSIEDIVNWLYQRIQGRATSLIIHGQKIEVEPNSMLMAIRKPSLLVTGDC